VCGVEEVQHLKVFEGCRKEWEQEFSEGPEVVESLEGFGPSKESKEGRGQVPGRIGGKHSNEGP
jgi:hypothetical protein